MRENMNITKVMIRAKHQKLMQMAARWLRGFCGRGLVVIQYSALVVRSGYTGNVVVLRVACTK